MEFNPMDTVFWVYVFKEKGEYKKGFEIVFEKCNFWEANKLEIYKEDRFVYRIYKIEKNE